MNQKLNKPLPVGIAANLSMAMLSRHALNEGCTIRVQPVTKEAAQRLAPLVLGQFASPAAASCVGWANSADVIGSELGVRLPQNRAPVTLELGDSLMLCHFTGARLPEFAHELPDATHLQYFLIEVEELDGGAA